MATQQQGIDTNAQIVGLAFVKQYYNVLVHSPQLLYKFYQDRSIPSHPCPNCQMLKINTVIKQQITSPDYSRFKVEIKAVDSQASHNNGVTVLEKGYFVLNDIFRYTDEEPDQPNHNLFPINGYVVERYAANADTISDSVVESGIEAQAQIGVIEQPTTMTEEPAPVVEKVHNEGPPASTQETPVVYEGAPEKSDGLIVKENAAPPMVPFQKPSLVRATARDLSSELSQATNSTSTAPKSSSVNKSLSSTAVNMTNKRTAEESGCSIFISNLHAVITPAQVEEELKKFGAIKPSGVQVRSSKGGRSCYAFVEFEEAASVRAAVQASPIPMGVRRVFIREKRIFPDREVFRNGGTRRPGGYSYGGQGNGRSEFMNNRAAGGSLSERAGGGFSVGYQREDNPIRNGRRGTQQAKDMVTRNGIGNIVA